MDKSFRTVPVIKDKSSKILLGSSSARFAYVAAQVGVAAKSEAQSSADMDVVRLCGSSCQSDLESIQLPLGVVYDCDGSH
jgi:hypothetical protein